MHGACPGPVLPCPGLRWIVSESDAAEALSPRASAAVAPRVSATHMWSGEARGASWCKPSCVRAHSRRRKGLRSLAGRAARARRLASLRPFGSRGWFPAPSAPRRAPPRSQLHFSCRFYSSPGAEFSTVSPAVRRKLARRDCRSEINSRGSRMSASQKATAASCYQQRGTESGQGGAAQLCDDGVESLNAFFFF